MIDQAAINFLVKLSLACCLLSLAIFKNVDCSPIQSEQERQYTASGSDVQPVGASAAANNIYQYQHPQQPQEYAQAQASPQHNFQYYDQQQAQQQQQPLQQHQYQQTYEAVAPETRPRPSSNKHNRRSILSSIMAPFTAMREQGVAMLSASLQGCQPGTFSLWCRFWGMFMKR